MSEKKTQVAVVYHSVAIYRKAIFTRLFNGVANPEYTLFAGVSSNQPSVKLVDSGLAHKVLQAGGWRWKIIRNYWLGQVLLQPRILLIPFQRKWDCVIFLGNAYYLTTWIAAFACRLTGKRVLMWTHGYRNEAHGWTAAFKKRFYQIAHGLLLYGKRGKNALVEQGFAAERLYLVYNSLDYATHLELRKQFANQPSIAPTTFGNSFPVIVWAGRFNVGKQLEILLKAVAALFTKGTSVNLLLIGDGPEKEAIGQLAAELDLGEQVYFSGPVYDESELARYFMGCDLAVSPGPVGVFAIHAQTFGLPVITCDDWNRQGPESESIEAGLTGSFFEAGNAVALANAIEQWLGRLEDKSALREACYQQIDRFYTPDYQERIIALAVAGEPA